MVEQQRRQDREAFEVARQTRGSCIGWPVHWCPKMDVSYPVLVHYLGGTIGVTEDWELRTMRLGCDCAPCCTIR